MKSRSELRAWRKKRIRRKVQGTTARPRLSVFRSASHIYAQVINDEEQKTLIAASSLSEEVGGGEEKNKTQVAQMVGELVAKKCLESNIKLVVFDRNGFVYHGRIKALAEAARSGGLEF